MTVSRGDTILRDNPTDTKTGPWAPVGTLQAWLRVAQAHQGPSMSLMFRSTCDPSSTWPAHLWLRTCFVKKLRFRGATSRANKFCTFPAPSVMCFASARVQKKAMSEPEHKLAMGRVRSEP